MYGQDKDEVVLLYLDDIIPNRFQPREVFDERALKELAVSIKEHGVIQPIIVRNVNGKYEIIAGERRYKASALAGLTKIPAIIRDLDDKESSKVALLENLQRKNLNAIEEARTYQKILELDEMTQEELAKTMGKSQSAVANKIRLLSLSDEIQDALLKEQISERHARALLNVPDAKTQKDLLKKIIDTKMSVRKLEEEINNLYPKPKSGSDIPIAELKEASVNGFLNDNPLIPTAVNIEDESSNYGKVVIAPPKEEETSTSKFINYGEINKEDNENFTSTELFELPPEIPTAVDVNKIKEESSDIKQNPTGSDLDGLLHINSAPITPAEQIVKENSTTDNTSSDDYFKTPDLSAIQLPEITNIIEPETTQEEIRKDASQEDTTANYTIEEATEKIRNLVDDLKSHGISINADEMNFPKSYQVIIKIDKQEE